MIKPRHIPALDGLRGYAALLVVLSHLNKVHLADHAPPFSGALGVLIFFVLSGFLISHLYLAKPIDRRSVYNYVVARMARIAPLFILTLAAAYALSQIVGPKFVYYMDLQTFLRQLTFTGSAYVFWSIPPEVQFYFVFIVAWWIVASRRLLSWMPLILFLVSVIFVARPAFPGNSVLGELQVFTTGVLVASIRRIIEPAGLDRRLVTAVQVASVVIVALLVTNAVPLLDVLPKTWRSNDTIYGYLPAVLLCGAALLAISIPTHFSTAVFANRAAAKLGAYSFSLYLLHEPVLDLVQRLTAAAGAPWILQLTLSLSAAVLVAALSYYAIEMPAQRLLRSFAKRFEPNPAPI